MKRQWKKGESNLDAVLIIAFLIIVFLSAPKRDSGTNSSFDWTPGSTVTSSGSNSNSSSGSTVAGTQIRTAPKELSQAISLGSGNAAYSYQSYEEYITIDNHGDTPINITNWQLRNGKDKRAYYQGGSLQRFSADVAVIPQATALLAPNGNNVLQDVVLEDNERAIIITGRPTVQTPYKITSFKENMCTGYLEASPDYAFSPPLNQSCPRPADEPGVENLEPNCRNFIKTLPSCQTPEITRLDRNGKTCNNCVNGVAVSNACIAFIQERFSYRGCVANHAKDENFSGRTWRVFLGRGWEMWAKEYETIELYNQFGQLVDFQNY